MGTQRTCASVENYLNTNTLGNVRHITYHIHRENQREPFGNIRFLP